MVAQDEPASGEQAVEPLAGRVLGTEDSTPLDFWVAVADGSILQLDDVVALERVLPAGDQVRIYGVVAQVRARHEGARFDSDVFLIEDGVLPAEVSESAQVLATRFEPEVFVPPLPGTPVRRAVGADRFEALFFDGMERRLPAGLTRDDEPLYLDLDFVDGTRGAHVNISGISGRRHEDQLRDVPPLLPVRVRRARRRGRQHQGPGLQREGRGPAVAGPAEPTARRAAGGPLRPGGSAGGRLPERGLLRATPPRRAHAGARRRQPGHRHRVLLLDPGGLLPAGAVALPVRGRRGRPPAVHDGRPQRDRPAAGGGAGRRRRGVDRGRGGAQLPRPRRPHPGPPDGRGGAAGPALGRAGHRRRHGQRVHPPSVRGGAPRPAPGPRGRARPRASPRRPRASGHGGGPPQPQRPGQALRRRRRAAQGLRGQGAGRPGTAAPVRGAGRAQQVRAPGRVQPDQGDPAGRGRARPLAGDDPARRAADGQRGRAPDRGQLRRAGRRPPRCRGGCEGRVRLPARGAAGSSEDPEAGDDARRAARAAGSARGRVPVPGLGHPTQRGRAGWGAGGSGGGADDPFAGLP